MSKPVLGLLLGGFLGLIDGVSAYAYPAARAGILGIVIGSTFKGLITGLAAGLFARWFRSLPLGILVGVAVGGLFSWWVAANSPLDGKYYYWEIVLPGTLLGVVVGFATQRFGRDRTPRTA